MAELVNELTVKKIDMTEIEITVRSNRVILFDLDALMM